MPREGSGPAGGEKVPLSRRQKRDLLELAVAGGMSAFFFAAPVFLVRETPARPTTAPQVRRPAATSTDARVQIVTTDVAAAVSTPALQFSPAASRALRRPARAPRSQRALGSAPTRVPLGRRLARLFAGDGRHTVQPFPTLPSTQR